MNITMRFVSSTLTCCLLAAAAYAAPVGIDGTIGGEWAGYTPVSVTYNSGAPMHNFGAPTSETNGVSYDIYTRGDSDYVYVGLITTGDPVSYAGANLFANLYFSTDVSMGSNIGFEVNNQQAFVPGVPGYYPYTALADDIHFATTGPGVVPAVIEFAAPWEVFTENALGLSNSLPAPAEFVQLRLSQAFGYSVAGGTSYGDDRLGIIPVVPEPSTLALVALGMCGVFGLRRRH